RGSAPLGRLQIVELDLLVDRGPTDAEDLRRLRLVPVDVAERALDGLLLDLGERRRRPERLRVTDRDLCRRDVRGVRGVRDVEVLARDPRALAEDDGALDDVAE